MENEIKPVVITIPKDHESQHQNPSARGLFSQIRSVAFRLVANLMLRINEPSTNSEPPPTVLAPPSTEELNMYLQPTEDDTTILISIPPPTEEVERRRSRYRILKIIMEQKLGKYVLYIGAATAAAVLISGTAAGAKRLSFVMHMIVSGLCIGSAAIWNGILLRETFPRQATFIEQFGIVLVLICLNGLAASFLPIHFIWLPILCGGLCLLPFIMMMIRS